MMPPACRERHLTVPYRICDALHNRLPGEDRIVNGPPAGALKMVKETPLSHGPATDWSKDRASGFKARTGIWMFILYTVVYIGFVVINTFYPNLMASDIGSLNLAVVYGFGLILFALMLAFVYNAICSAAEEEMNPPAAETDPEEDA